MPQPIRAAAFFFCCTGLFLCLGALCVKEVNHLLEVLLRVHAHAMTALRLVDDVTLNTCPLHCPGHRGTYNRPHHSYPGNLMRSSA